MKTVNGNLPDSDPGSVCLWHFNSGGSATGFGGCGLFRGYVNVSGTASIIYQWKAGAEFRGAVHHVSAASGFQMNASVGPLKIAMDEGVFEDLGPLGVLTQAAGAPLPPAPPPPPGAPPVAAVVRLFDMKIRPFMFSRWF